MTGELLTLPGEVEIERIDEVEREDAG